MPEAGMAVDVDEALAIAERIGYPVMVRPSYVLGGRGMEVVYDPENLKIYMEAAEGVTPDRPILIDRFLRHAMECEADAISDGEHAFVPAVMEHIELAGVHSGDSACIIPSRHISEENLKTIKEYTKKIAEEMHVKGLMNMQYAIEDGVVYVLEANPRASRTVPLVSKVCAISMVPLATEIITSEFTGKESPIKDQKDREIPYYGVKEAVFPFNMFQEVDPLLGPEMRSTGEVLGLAQSVGEAYFKAQEATKSPLPLSGTVLISVGDREKAEVAEVAKRFHEAGFAIIATRHTKAIIEEAGIPVEFVYKMSEGRPNIYDIITNGKVDLVVNTPKGEEEGPDDSYVRRACIKSRVPYITTMAASSCKCRRYPDGSETERQRSCFPAGSACKDQIRACVIKITGERKNGEKIIQVDEKVPVKMLIPLSLQHMFAMFETSVLVPFLFGISPAIVLLMNGVGTLVFIVVTKGKAPAYLGSSFAFLVPAGLVIEKFGYQYALGSFVAIGFGGIIVALIIRKFGTKWIHIVLCRQRPWDRL